MRAHLSPSGIDDLSDRAWPALERVEVDGWVVRLSEGVTQRANSVLPLRSPRDVQRALDSVESAYAERGLATVFQISPAAEPSDLDRVLEERGYAYGSATAVQSADVPGALAALGTVEGQVLVEDEPSSAWLDCWWAVDGRGGAAAREVARRVLTGVPAVYVCALDAAGVVAVGRLALVGSWGGIYCMAVRADARGRGWGRTVLAGLLEQAQLRGLDSVWLQVVEGNAPAQRLYASAGFRPSSRYHYRTLVETRRGPP